MNIHPSLAEIVRGSHLQCVANWIGEHLAVGCDAISLTFFLSRAAARLGIPFNLIVNTEVPAALRIEVDRLLQCGPPNVVRADRIEEFRKLLTKEPNNLDVILVRSLHQQLLGFALEAVSRDVRGEDRIPAIWWIGDQALDRAPSGATLQLITTREEHCLKGFGHHFSLPAQHPGSPDRVTPQAALEHILDNLTPRQRFEVPFKNFVRARLRPDEMLVVNRLMCVIAALRFPAIEQAHNLINVRIEDFRLAKALLGRLPVVALHDRLPPYAIETATTIWEHVSAPEYQLTVPDMSDLGQKGFARSNVIEWTGLSYNAAKEHLMALEDAGIVEATVQIANRKQGRRVFYTFNSAVLPPFHRRNPYAELPTSEQIAANCSSAAQS